jgi:cysteine sulfinate desulfinase/cysteine desulfurase-like protein
LKGAAFARGVAETRIITTSVEHPSVLQTCRWLESMGAEVTYLPVDANGMVDPDEVARTLRRGADLVSVMLANNETGTVQPVAELSRLAHEAGALMHSDAVQCPGKVPVDVAELGVDMLSVSAHKLHGPKGVGALYVGRGVELAGVVHGGGQEHGLRSGTENVSGIGGFGKAVEFVPEYLSEAGHVAALRDGLEAGLRGLFPEMRLNGHPSERLPNTLNVTLPGFRGESLVLALDRYGISLSSGSACKSGSPEPSHALLAMGMSRDDAHCSLRFSLDTETTGEDVEYAIASVREVLERSREFVHFAPCR